MGADKSHDIARTCIWHFQQVIDVKKILAALTFLLNIVAVGAFADHAPSVRVFAASSLTNVLQDIGKLYTQQTDQQVVFSFAASSTLARQIEAGADADAFISADEDWMNYLEQRNLLKPNSRATLLGNSLVLVVPADSNITVDLKPRFSLGSILKNERLAIADPDSVPAGKYARSALMSLNIWHDVEGKLIKADSVRTALNYVALKESPLGIVYETDALIDKRVRIVYRFNESTHAPIHYPIALTSTAAPSAAAFVRFLQSPEVKAIFSNYGFKVY